MSTGATLPDVFRELNCGPRLRVAVAMAVDEALADASGGKRQLLTTLFTACNTALNAGRDSTAPAISARQNLAGVNVVRVTFNDALDPYAVPDPAAFAITPVRAITAVRVQGNYVDLVYSGAKLLSGDTPQVAYTQPAATAVRLRDKGGNLAATAAAAAVTVL